MRRQQHYLRIRSVKSIDPELSGTTSDVVGNNTNWEVGNFGDSGHTMLKGGGYSYWDSQLYKNALASNPKYLILKVGTNYSKRWLWDSHGSEFKKQCLDRLLV
jgi:hypothetical protein